MSFSAFRVSKVVRESDTIKSFFLVPANGQSLIDYQPGQFLSVRLKIKGAAQPVVRNYTMSDRPGKDYYRLTIKKENGGLVSSHLHDHVAKNDILEISSPLGHFQLEPGNEPVVLLSGGVGITPMMSMIEHIAINAYSRRVYFIHSSINQSVQPFWSRLMELKMNHSKFSISIHHSNPELSERAGLDYDVKGKIDREHLHKNVQDLKTATYYLCGPTGFMKAMYNHLSDLGVDEHQIRYEFFGENKPLRKVETEKERNGLKVALAKRNQSLIWTGNHNSLLELVEANNIGVDSMCRMGTCGSCSTKLVNGSVKYDPEPFIEVDSDQVLLCCAQPNSEIELDL